MTFEFDHIVVETPKNRYFKNLVEYVRDKFDNPDYHNTVFLISTAVTTPVSHYREIYKNKRIVMYNWEQLCGGNQWLNVSDYCKRMEGADELWDYDYLNREYMRLYHNVEVDRVQPIEYVPAFERIEPVPDPKIDVLFYGLINERRSRLITDIRFKSYDRFSVVTAAGCNAALNEHFIANSKIILNIHAFEPWHRQEQERIAFLLSNKKCVLSEPSQFNHFGDAILEVHPEHLYDKIVDLLDGDKWREVGENGYRAFNMDFFE